MNADPLLTTVTGESVRERLDRQQAYLTKLAGLLRDLEPAPGSSRLEPETGHSREVRVAGLTIWLDTERFHHRVIISTGSYKRGSRRTYAQTKASHIAKQVRRIVQEQAEKHIAGKAYMDALTAKCEREQAALAPLQALADSINARAIAAAGGKVDARKVRQLTADEVEHGITRSWYRFDAMLENLSEGQVRAILQIIEQGGAR